MKYNMSKSDWLRIGSDAGWIKSADISKRERKRIEAIQAYDDKLKKILMSGNAPESLIERIKSDIINRGYIEDYAEEWIKNILESENPAQWLVDAINERIKKDGRPPSFAKDWVDRQLMSGKAPRWWIETANKKIESEVQSPFGWNFYESQMKPGKDPPEWVKKLIINTIINTGSIPDFAYMWVDNVLKQVHYSNIMEVEPTLRWLVMAINKRAKLSGEFPGWATVWRNTRRRDTRRRESKKGKENPGLQ